MAKPRNPLSGSAKDAYLRQRLASAAECIPGGAEQLLQRLQSEITRVWVRTAALADVTADAVEAGVDDALTAEPPSDASEACATVFDPFTPNVVVVLRVSGRAQALAALGHITETANLKLLAREQQLGIDPELDGIDELRAAIVSSAERRIANRRAAAS